MPVTLFSAPATGLSDAEIAPWRRIPVAVAVDLGRTLGQIDPAIRPLRPAGQQPRLFGRAVTVQCVPPDLGAMLHVLDVAGPGDVVMMAAGGHAETAMVGEILAGQLRRRGVAGLVCDGAIRDVGTLAQWDDFSVFTRHVMPRGPVSADQGTINGPVTLGGVLVSPGDLILGDDDGLVALTPATVRARLADAEAKLKLEANWEKSLIAGVPVREIFGLAEPLGPG